jgi:hypothetical protein
MVPAKVPRVLRRISTISLAILPCVAALCWQSLRWNARLTVCRRADIEVVPIKSAFIACVVPGLAGHRNIQHTVRYTELAPTRFKNFWHN